MKNQLIKAFAFFIIINSIGSLIFAEEALTLSFRELSGIQESLSQNFSLDDSLAELKDKYDKRPVRIRGFLYRSQDGRWVLASEPNLKSCCVGSEAKAMQQIIVDGRFEKQSLEPVIVEGVFLVEAVSGNRKELFKLGNAHIYEERKHGVPYMSLVVFSIVLVGIAFGWRFWRTR